MSTAPWSAATFCEVKEPDLRFYGNKAVSSARYLKKIATKLPSYLRYGHHPESSGVREGIADMTKTVLALVTVVALAFTSAALAGQGGNGNGYGGGTGAGQGKSDSNGKGNGADNNSDNGRF